MGLLNRLFTGKSKSSDPDNSKLFELLIKYQNEKGQGDSYINVVQELMSGNAFLLLPSENGHGSSATWTTAEKDTTLQLTCIFDLDGLRVLGAFTDESSLLKWAKRPTPYTALSSKDIMKLCEKNRIDRIVINSDQPDMFVLERNRDNVKTLTIGQDTSVQVGSPLRPLDERIVQLLIEQFKKIDTINEVYLYGQTRSNEFSLVLGFKLMKNSDNAKTAAINAVQTALNGEKLDQLLDLYFIEDDDWYQTIRNISQSMVYKR